MPSLLKMRFALEDFSFGLGVRVGTRLVGTDLVGTGLLGTGLVGMGFVDTNQAGTDLVLVEFSR